MPNSYVDSINDAIANYNRTRLASQQAMLQQRQLELDQQKQQSSQQQSVFDMLMKGAKPVNAQGNVQLPENPTANPAVGIVPNAPLNMPSQGDVSVAARPEQSVKMGGHMLEAPTLADQMARETATQNIGKVRMGDVYGDHLPSGANPDTMIPAGPAVESSARVQYNAERDDARREGDQARSETAQAKIDAARTTAEAKAGKATDITKTNVAQDANGNFIVIQEHRDGGVKVVPTGIRGMTKRSEDMSPTAWIEQQKFHDSQEQNLILNNVLQSAQGDPKKAQQYLRQGMVDNPNGLEKKHFATTYKALKQMEDKPNPNQELMDYLQKPKNSGTTSPPVAAAPAATSAGTAKAAAPSQQTNIAVGATATNPKTKKQVRWDGKQWQPI